MKPSNRIILAAAGAGKTTEMVKDALGMRPKKVAIATYTQKNVEEIRKKIIQLNNGFIPPEIVVYPWYTFVLHEMARPYQGCLHERRITSLNFVKGVTKVRAKKTDIARYYFDSQNQVYSDRMSDFALRCNEISGGKVIRRLEDMYSHIFIDEVQDLAGFDIDVLELLLRSRIGITLVGDVRQSTFRTSYAPKNRQFCGRGFLRKVKEWEKAGLCEPVYLCRSYRCVQAICDLADSIFSDLPPTRSENHRVTGHDGVFVVRSGDVPEYIARFRPKILRLNKRFGRHLEAENFGVVKGLGFERVLIVPYKGITNWVRTGDPKHVSKCADEVYVGITRAYQSVAFIHDGELGIPGISIFDPRE